MGNKVYTADYAGHALRYAFHYDGTEKYLFPYIQESDETEWDVLAEPAYIESQRPYYTECTEDRYVEYKSLIGLSSLALLSARCCFYHAVAIKWRDRAWLITAPPGTGKTTQYKNWRILFRSEVEMICGDMPLLEFRPDGSIWVHPSPWNGKERIRGKASARLSGLVYLEQGPENRFSVYPETESVVPILQQFAVLPDTVEQVEQLVSMEDQLLRQIPIWKFVNLGDHASTRMMRDVFAQRVMEEET